MVRVVESKKKTEGASPAITLQPQQLGHLLDVASIREVQIVSDYATTNIITPGNYQHKVSGGTLTIKSPQGAIDIKMITGHLPSLVFSDVRGRTGMVQIHYPNRTYVMIEVESNSGETLNDLMMDLR